MPEKREMREIRATQEVAKAVAQSNRIKSKSILYVEDGLLMRDLLSFWLDMHGFNVTTAGTLSDARLVYTKMDMLILDRRLPDGDGLTLAKDLRAMGSKVPIIVMSADQSRDGDEFVDEWFEKPADLDTLVAAIERLL